MHSAAAMTAYSIVAHIIAGVTFTYTALALARLRPRRKRKG